MRRTRTRTGQGIGSFLQKVLKTGRRAASSDIGKAVIAAAKPLVKAAVQRKLAQRGINIGSGLRLAGRGGRKRKAPRRRAAAIPKQTIYL